MEKTLTNVGAWDHEYDDERDEYIHRFKNEDEGITIEIPETHPLASAPDLWVTLEGRPE